MLKSGMPLSDPASLTLMPSSFSSLSSNEGLLGELSRCCSEKRPTMPPPANTPGSAVEVVLA